MKKTAQISFSLLFSILLFSSQGMAQSATTSASGTVLEPLTVSATALSFGSEIFPGINESVAKTAPESAQFDISGEAGKEITATLTLPTELAGGTTPLPITFSTTDGSHATASTEQSSATDFDPNGALTTTLEAATGELFIWLGGTVEPASDQPAGAYTADITLDTVYTGN